MKQDRHALIAHFGSLRSTLALLVLLAAVVLGGSVSGNAFGVGVALVIALLSLNLLAALVVHPAFRRQLPLLVAHLALLALVLLAGFGRLAALDGRFELTQGVPFDGQLIEQHAGALHPGTLPGLQFRHDGFDIDYAPGRKRGPTRNRVTWIGADGRPQSATIGDHKPLVLDGYRIYTSPNKGFAPVLRWVPTQGAPVAGAVHLPSYPMHELRQSREWPLPDGRSAWVMLQFDEQLLDPQAAASFRLPKDHRLVLRLGEQRFELAPGEGAAIAGGTIVYDGLRTWMGYRVAYDPTLPWLLAAALLAALSLGWHYLRKFGAAPRALPLVQGARAGVIDG